SSPPLPAAAAPVDAPSTTPWPRSGARPDWTSEAHPPGHPYRLLDLLMRRPYPPLRCWSLPERLWDSEAQPGAMQASMRRHHAAVRDPRAHAVSGMRRRKGAGLYEQATTD